MLITSKCTVPRRARSFLAEQTLLDYADGLKSSVGVARTCAAGRRDGLSLVMLDKLADIGNTDMAHCSERLHTLLQNSGCYSHVTQTGGEDYSHCILPSEVIKLIARKPDKFKMHIAPSREACKDFWRGFMSSPEGLEYASSHPVLAGKSLDELADFIPIRIHEDAGPFTKTGAGVNIINWSSLLGRGNEKETRYCCITTQMAVLILRTFLSHNRTL